MSNHGRRFIHRRRELDYPVEGGLGNFLPPPALKTMLEYQDGLLERLNQELRTEARVEPHSSVANTVVRYAQMRERTLAFNYAVLALNNSFFLEQLAPPEMEDGKYVSHQQHISDELFESIRANYGDLLRLKSTFSAAAMGLFTNGWIWMVTDLDGNLAVLHTLGPSTLLVRSRMNTHYNPDLVIGETETGLSLSNDLPLRPLPQNPMSPMSPPGVAPSLPGSGVSSLNPRGPFDPHVRSVHSTSIVRQLNSLHGSSPSEADAKGSLVPPLLSTGKVLLPLFCVPVYEHAWMSAGFGVWGKEAWLKEFWTVLDWKKVSRAYRVARESTRHS
ncbi:hypothetical protein CPC08DRAFT_757063 [Agrocybe pediades]|nr:hypothetical protein CPC08DRAFT_757063 [Agrocybe pediades]